MNAINVYWKKNKGIILFKVMASLHIDRLSGHVQLVDCKPIAYIETNIVYGKKNCEKRELYLNFVKFTSMQLIDIFWTY